MSKQRLSIPEVAPEGTKAVFALEQYVRGQVDHDVLHLVKLRASMTNGCAFCVDMHSTDTLRSGEDLRRVVGVAAWRESSLYTDEERIALELTDAVTAIGAGGVSDETWDRAVAQFGEKGVADLVLAIATINVWNRIAVSTRTALPSLDG